jgi:hypothetical protein
MSCDRRARCRTPACDGHHGRAFSFAYGPRPPQTEVRIMLVVPQGLTAHFKGEEAFDFFVGFFIVNPENKCTEAVYSFNKYGSGKKPQEAGFKGSLDFNTAENKPFRYNSFAGKLSDTVEAQVDLASSRNDRFTITVTRPKKSNFSVDLTFMGEVPDWLSKGQVWHGKLAMYDIKDPC